MQKLYKFLKQAMSLLRLTRPVIPKRKYVSQKKLRATVLGLSVSFQIQSRPTRWKYFEWMIYKGEEMPTLNRYKRLYVK